MTDNQAPELKPREFWIPLITLIVNSDEKRKTADTIHVIDFKAYAKLETQHATLVEASKGLVRVCLEATPYTVTIEPFKLVEKIQAAIETFNAKVGKS